MKAFSGDPEVSVVVPVFREGEGINAFLAALLGQETAIPFEVLVVDGEGRSTLDRIHPEHRARIRTLQSAKGRGCQMNAGAALARSPRLLFLHADARLPPLALERLVEALPPGASRAGAFDLAIDSPRPLLRFIARMASFRSRLTRLPYGDQGHFLASSLFRSLGGYPDWPLMEDVELMRRLKARRGRLGFVGAAVTVSARRWEKEGLLLCTLRNWALLGLFYLGVPPRILAGLYPPHPGGRRPAFSRS